MVIYILFLVFKSPPKMTWEIEKTWLISKEIKYFKIYISIMYIISRYSEITYVFDKSKDLEI